MKRFTATVFGLAALMFVVTGCVTSQQARHTKASAFLGDAASLLKPGAKGESLLVYFNPNVDWKQYQNVIIDPVTYWVGEGEKDGLDAKQQKAFVDYYHSQLVEQTQKYFTVVSTPQPHTIRYSVALINAEHSWPALSTISTVYPAALALSMIKEASFGKSSFVGEISGAMKATDAVTGELLGAASDERVGGMSWHGKFDRWDTVKDSSDYWAQQSVYRLCTLEGLTHCQKPADR